MNWYIVTEINNNLALVLGRLQNISLQRIPTFNMVFQKIK